MNESAPNPYEHLNDEELNQLFEQIDEQYWQALEQSNALRLGRAAVMNVMQQRRQDG